MIQITYFNILNDVDEYTHPIQIVSLFPWNYVQFHNHQYLGTTESQVAEEELSNTPEEDLSQINMLIEWKFYR